MNIFLLSIRNIFLKPLSYSISFLLLTLGSGIVTIILLINNEFDKQFKNNLVDIDLVVGAKGSPLQLVLSNVFHLDAPTGNISYEKAKSISKNTHIKKAIFLAYGDNYQSYRIVGTSQSYPEHFNVKIVKGNIFKKNYEVSIGHEVAKNLGLNVGDHFQGSHGLVGNHSKHENTNYHVTGIFQKSNTVIDRLILSNIKTIHDAHEDEHEEIEHSDEEITAILIQFNSPFGMFQLPKIIHQETSMQAALPTVEINRLFSLLGIGLDGLEMLAMIIISISMLSIFLSLYNSVKEKRYELALLRVMGASKLQLLQLTCQESILLVITAYLSSFFTSRLIFSNLLKQINQNDNIEILPIESELYFLTIIIILGFISAILPSIKAFKINISKVLSEN